MRRITAIANPVLRNLEITHCYARLSSALAARTGECANWCTFATWASRQAGRTIRAEDLGDTLRRRLGMRGRGWRHPLRLLWRALLRKGVFEPDTRVGRIVREISSPFDAFERASGAVARGNLKVFEEIGFECARFLAECPPDATPDSPEFERFAAGLRDGDPPDGQRYLRRAFARYQQQRSATAADTRAALIALANVEIGFHEQTRLQREICEALDAPLLTVREARSRVVRALAWCPRSWRMLVRGPVLWAVVQTARAYDRATLTLARRIITDHLMVLSLPRGVVLHLGRDIDAVPPACLQRIELPEFVELLGRFEPAGRPADDAGAEDWSDLSQRMHYIGLLFRSLHERRELFDPPFTRVQVEHFQSGRIPDGEL